MSLEHARSRKLRGYSKGMTQRAGICFALVHDPKLIILDEPMSGLDPIGRKEVVDLVLDLKAQGKTILFCSHILNDVERLCDRMAIMNKGRLLRVMKSADLTGNALEPIFFETIQHGVIMIKRIWYLAALTFREGIRDRAVFGVMGIALLMFLATIAMTSMFGYDVGKVAVDLNLSVVAFTGLLLCFFVNINLLAKDIDKRTIYCVLSKPISRPEYILGKYAGTLSLILMSIYSPIRIRRSNDRA